MPSAALLVVLLLTGIAWAEEKPPVYRYTAELENVSPDGGGYRLWFSLRKNGEPYVAWRPTMDGSHPERPRFQHDLTRLEKENIYYELIFIREMPRLKGVGFFNLGIVTKQTQQDLSELNRSLKDSQEPPLPITDLISIRPITQNEFLGVNPRIVKP